MPQDNDRAVVRRDPSRDFFEGWGPLQEFLGLPRFPRHSVPVSSSALNPAMDFMEDDEKYVLTAELAGAKPEDITIELHENVLSIRGEKRNEREGENEQCRWAERSYGSFARSFTLPTNGVADGVRASFADGVLTVIVPKAEESKPRQIKIES